MSVTASVLIPAKFAENAQTTQYMSDKFGTIIDKFTVTNVTGGAVTLSINLVNASGTPGNSNLIVQSKSITAGTTVSFAEELHGVYLGVDDYISTIASAANSLTIRASGRVITVTR